MTASPVPADPHAVRHGAAAPTAAGPLVDATWLRSRVGSPGLVLLHVDADASGYHLAHPAGALPLDAHDDLHDPVRRGPVTQQAFEALCDRLGIRRADHVVLCGGAPEQAAYAYWVFRYYGHPCVSLLDGGVAAWQRAGGEMTDALPGDALPGDALPTAVGRLEARRTGAAGGYRSPGPDPALRVTRDDVLRDFVGSPGEHLLLDCRTPAEYAGHSRHPLDLPLEHARAAGHIPGARNLPSSAVLTAAGTFLPEAELRRVFADSGVRASSDVALYCRTVERSSLLWYALHELVRHERARRYDGGWAEYSSLVDVPVGRTRTDAVRS